MKLLIVESPGKLKTLRKILGSGWLLEASVGHTTELAHDGAKKLGFELVGDRVETRYVPRGSRGKEILAKLRSAVKRADQVYLAMDPDREGESIAWHLVEQLRLKRFVRVSYTQITAQAVQKAIASPRSLDFPLIQAQRARQCLDKLVGYEVSPLLWNSSGGKSAGRVQSATLHLICGRERERESFKPEDYWTLQSHYCGSSALTAHYHSEPSAPAPRKAEASAAGKMTKAEGTAPGEPQTAASPGKVRSAEAAREIEAMARRYPHLVHRVQDLPEKRLPPPPLITSSLQQVAGVRFKFPPGQTMKIAQELYEGVAGLNGGLITYMRTDTVSLSDEFVSEARTWLAAQSPEALPERAPQFRNKAGAQAAHEAIRPTSVAVTPELARASLRPDQYQIYKLIWERAIASQCKAATLMKGEIEIHAGPTRWLARGMRIKDPGYLLYWKNTEDETTLPLVQEGQKLSLYDIRIEKKTTQPPPRYSEAKLVQLMEKLGIGRPSTYASTLLTLRDRNYVALEQQALKPTTLGLATDQVLTRAMPDLVDVRFTAKMESALDQIAEGKLAWEQFLCGWNSDYLQTALAQAREMLSGHPRPPSAFSRRPQTTFKNQIEPKRPSQFRSRKKPRARL